MPSPIDLLFQDIFGHLPRKAGAAYEQLAAIAMHALGAGAVKHDARIRGQFSETVYQVDALASTSTTLSMGEAKDYSAGNEKVGRDDIQKLAGALPDLKDVTDAAFFSATGFTAPAKKYAAAATDIVGKPITLYNLRPSTELDERGAIKTVILNLHLMIPQTQAAAWRPVFSEAGTKALTELPSATDVPKILQIQLRDFFDNSGQLALTIEALTSAGFADPIDDSNVAHGVFDLPGMYIKVEGRLIEILRLEYDMPYIFEVKNINISMNSETRLIITDADGAVLARLNDAELRRYEFTDDRDLVFK